MINYKKLPSPPTCGELVCPEAASASVSGTANYPPWSMCFATLPLRRALWPWPWRMMMVRPERWTNADPSTRLSVCMSVCLSVCLHALVCWHTYTHAHSFPPSLSPDLAAPRETAQLVWRSSRRHLQDSPLTCRASRQDSLSHRSAQQELPVRVSLPKETKRQAHRLHSKH